MLSFPFREPIIEYDIPANIAADNAINAVNIFEFIILEELIIKEFIIKEGFIIKIEPIAAIIIPSHCTFKIFSLIRIKAKKLAQKGEVFCKTDEIGRAHV